MSHHWTKGPLLSEAAEQCEEAIRRHALAFPDEPGGHGLDRLVVRPFDLQTLEEIGLLLGMTIDLPDLGPLDDCILIAQGFGGVIGRPDARIWWRDDMGIRRICHLPDGPMLIAGGLTEAIREDAHHKILAALGLVPWRNLDHLPVDVDGDGYVWLDVEADGSWEARDA